jgi:hypothetical protein
VNGPLQQRGSVLDSDYDRANKLPDDYDTDLESEWANESKFISSSALNYTIYLELFADGGNFSSETIKKGRNTYYQNQMV